MSNTVDRMNVNKRTIEAWKLRQSGMTYAAIGRALGIGGVQARNLVRKIESRLIRVEDILIVSSNRLVNCLLREKTPRNENGTINIEELKRVCEIGFNRTKKMIGCNFGKDTYIELCKYLSVTPNPKPPQIPSHSCRSFESMERMQDPSGKIVDVEIRCKTCKRIWRKV